MSPRTGLTGSAGTFTGSALIRLLARLNDSDAPPSKLAFSDRLSHWLGWTDAISLAAALDGAPAPATTKPAPATGAAEEDLECLRLRKALAKSIAADDPAGRLPADSEPKPDFLPYRRHCFAKQRAMEASIGPLRTRLRETLATRSPEMARLAAVDAVMEQLLGARERGLVATVPVLLEKRFERLRQADAAASTEWLGAFRQDMHAVLLAELDLRFQPVEGLLSALRVS